MAVLNNDEKNLTLEICFINVLEDIYEKPWDDYETWIPFILCLTLPDKKYNIEEDIRATLSVYEIRNLIKGIEKILENLGKGNKNIYEFCSIEFFFRMTMEVLPEDEVVEVELWINVANQTNGKLYGYEEGVRFGSDKEDIVSFLTELKKEFEDVNCTLEEKSFR